jgi:hypothetical protein
MRALATGHYHSVNDGTTPVRTIRELPAHAAAMDSWRFAGCVTFYFKIEIKLSQFFAIKLQVAVGAGFSSSRNLLETS